MNIYQKDIVLVPFPFSDRNETKVRPALVISNNKFNERSLNFILIPITSILKSVPYSFPIKQENLSVGKLIVESRIRIDKFFTLDKQLIKFKIGSLNDETYARLKKEMLTLF